MSQRIALLVPEFCVPGGVTQVSLFLRDVLQDTKRYGPEVISLAMGARDPASSQITTPSTWLRGALVEEKTWSGISYRHVGARWSELEFQRYRPRTPLTELLQSYDLVQIVAGTPAWARVTQHVDVPVALQVATLTAVERDGQNTDYTFLRRLWHAGMTQIVSRMETNISSLVDAIFVENTWMYDHFRAAAGEGKVHFAPPGIDTEVYHPRGDTGKSNRADEDYILSVGRFGDSRKNVRLLFEAYHRLQKKVTDVPKLVLAGLSGPTDRDWERAEALGILSHVEMYENIPEEDLAEFYRDANLFVMSSNEEGLGIVLAEAMASGTPVVSTDCGGPSTLIENGTTGFLTPVGEAEPLADRMAYLLSRPQEAASIGRAGRARIEEEFSVEAAGEKYLRVYDEILNME